MGAPPLVRPITTNSQSKSPLGTCAPLPSERSYVIVNFESPIVDVCFRTSLAKLVPKAASFSLW